MKRTRLFMMVVGLLALAGSTRADVVRLDLKALGCPSQFPGVGSHSWWSTNFDLGVQFSQIDNVYMDWSGSITGSRIAWDDQTISAIDSGLGALFADGPVLRDVASWAGEPTYPTPEVLAGVVSFTQTHYPLPQWNDILDGTGTIKVELTYYILVSGTYLTWGTASLDRAELVFEGVTVPEPCAVSLMAIGAVLVRQRGSRKSIL